MAQHHHQASLEGILDFSLDNSLTESQRNHGSRRFLQIISYFDVDDGAAAGEAYGATYNRPRLVRLTYEYALSDESRDLLLQAFFRCIQLRLDDEGDVALDDLERIRSDVVGFAEYLMDSFYLPRMWRYPSMVP